MKIFSKRHLLTGKCISRHIVVIDKLWQLLTKTCISWIHINIYFPLKNDWKLSPQFKCPTANALCAGGEERNLLFNWYMYCVSQRWGKIAFKLFEYYTCIGNNSFSDLWLTTIRSICQVKYGSKFKLRCKIHLFPDFLSAICKNLAKNTTIETLHNDQGWSEGRVLGNYLKNARGNWGAL